MTETKFINIDGKWYETTEAIEIARKELGK